MLDKLKDATVNAIVQKCNQKTMHRLFKTIGAVSIVALTLAAVAQSSAQSISNLPIHTICVNALNSERTAWDQSPTFSKDVAEAARRGLTVDACRQLLAPEVVTPTAPTGSSTQTSNLSDPCVNARDNGHGWLNQNPTFSTDVPEAVRRSCRLLLGLLLAEAPLSLPTPSSPESEITDGGTSEQGAFLEAALFFITGVDASSNEIVSNRKIKLGRYPIVAYLVDSNPCAIRLRTTTLPYTVWQMDFCKITNYEQSHDMGPGIRHYRILWRGYKTAFCTYRGWDKNANYTGPIGEPDSTCSILGEDYAPHLPQNWYVAWSSDLDVLSLIEDGKARGGQRSVDRMIASFKYIVRLLTPPEQRKQY
jgi:hypothetical protein